MNRDLMFSSASAEWSTPQDLFDRLHAEFRFGFDLAATIENRKVAAYYGPDHRVAWRTDGLRMSTRDWRSIRWGWCNPPYTRGVQEKFIKVCALRRRMVMLLPARTDTAAFHDYIYNERTYKARERTEIRLLRGRLKFGGCKDAAPFPSMVVVFR